jgi:hypothetical protein
MAGRIAPIIGGSNENGGWPDDFGAWPRRFADDTRRCYEGQGNEIRELELHDQAAESATLNLQPPGQHPITLPDLILIDGGKASSTWHQRNSRNSVWPGSDHRLGEGSSRYLPGKSEPLRLSRESGALKLLQRVRDESHRFANTYNAQLRLKRISESVLDEFPGIGGQRKAALLKKFGSVQRLRLATVEQIAQVSGFGGKAAAELKAFIEARSTPAAQVNQSAGGSDRIPLRIAGATDSRPHAHARRSERTPEAARHASSEAAVTFGRHPPSGRKGRSHSKVI